MQRDATTEFALPPRETGDAGRLAALEVSLRERERQLDEAYRIAHLGSWHWELADDVVTWSRGVFLAFDLDPELPVPRHEEVETLHTRESFARLGAAIGRAKTHGEPYALDVEIILHDGSTRWLAIRGEAAARGANGTVTALRGTVQNITDRKLAEIALEQREGELRETQTRFQKLYDANLLGICYPDKHGAFFDGNDEFLRIVGYTREELRSGEVRWDTMTPPEYADLDATHIAEAARRGSCTPYEKEYIRKDGRRTPILCGYALLHGSEDNYIGFVLDISAQKEAERAVREQEQRFRDLAESLPQLVWASDPEGNRIYTNQHYLDYAGLAFEELQGGLWRQVFHPEDLDRTVLQWERCMATGDAYLNEYRIRRHDGMYRTFLVRAVAVRNADGVIERWLGSATDIHDQKVAEEALRRTEKLAATGRLAASIAHEINNPLEAVMNSLYLALQDNALDVMTRSYLLVAEQELERVAQVATQTLRFHRQSVAAGEADLGEIMDSAYELFAGRLRASSITVAREYEEGQTLHCNGDEMRQVFANFLSNAMDATRKGGRLRIRIRPAMDWRSSGERGMRVTIADTGHGVPANLRQAIFEPFITTKDTTGTGLGLWVSDGIVQKHKGRIALRSRSGAEGHGTVFRLFFPLDGLKGAAAAATAPSS